MVKKAPEELYREREQRFNDALALKTPDRVPFAPLVRFYCTRQQGLTIKEACSEPERAFPAFVKTMLEISPDLAHMPGLLSAQVADAMGILQMRFPGKELPEDVHWQFVEKENMKAEEYDAFLSNPGEFAIKTLLPRMTPVLEFLQEFPPFISLSSAFDALSTVPKMIMGFMDPQFGSTLERLIKAAKEQERYLKGQKKACEQLKAAGFPILYEVLGMVPFDFISDFWRGMRGTMLDMRRNPDKLLSAIELLTPIFISDTVASFKKIGNPRILIPLHRGSAAFMSNKDFETFYWPGLKTTIEELVKEGMQPMPFFEGDYTPRLEYLTELPRGKVLVHLERTDAIKAHEVLGDRLCIKGNIPASLLIAGTPEKVDQWCKNLIEAFDGRGLVMGGAVAIPADAKPENVRAIAEACHKYGPAHR